MNLYLTENEVLAFHFHVFMNESGSDFVCGLDRRDLLDRTSDLAAQIKWREDLRLTPDEASALYASMKLSNGEHADGTSRLMCKLHKIATKND